MTQIALLLAGFSIFSAMSLALTQFRGELYQHQPMSRAMGLTLLLALAGLQWAHFAWLALDRDWVSTLGYRVTLFLVAPAFFLFSQPLLRPRTGPAFRPAMLWHGAPLLIAPLLTQQIALPLAFVVGAGYLLWLARSLYALRAERAAFGVEMVLLGAVFVIALVVSLLGLFQASLPPKLFFSLYAIAIGLAFFLVQTTLGQRPRLPLEVRETVQAAHASSSLSRVDCDSALARLDALMTHERLFTDANLNLPALADRLGVSTHQLSELLNARLGKGFSRYLREQRVAAAKLMLHDEPSASVLSVGLCAGFSSQSTFYDAFREIEGMTPGMYRKLKGDGQPPGSPSA